MSDIPTPAKSHDQAHTTREDWLECALTTLIAHGIDRVKIQVMARDLNVSRSSFYWFFTDTADLHRQMMDVWIGRNTDPILNRAATACDNINQNILHVFECWVTRAHFDQKLDVAVRLWARRSDAVRRIVVNADDTRLAALQDMFIRYGYDEVDALVRARVLYYTQIGQYTLEVQEDTITRLSRAGHFAATYSGQPMLAQDYAYFLQRARDMIAAAGEDAVDPLPV